VARLVDQFGATAVAPLPVPSPPDGLGPREGVDVTAMPLPVVLQLTAPPAPSQRTASLLQAAFDLPVSVTSEAAACR